MITYTTLILRFESKGDKTGWTYIEVPADVADQLMPGNRKSFRVKGLLDDFPIAGIALLPMGEGVFILALNSQIRKGIRKAEGALLNVALEVDHDYKVEVPPELEEFFAEDPDASEYFYSITKSHRDYFIKWIDSAKTAATREKRIIASANAFSNGWDYGQMIRAQRILK